MVSAERLRGLIEATHCTIKSLFLTCISSRQPLPHLNMFEISDLPAATYTARVYLSTSLASTSRTFTKVLSAAASCAHRSSPPKLIDGFTFNNELDMLELRLETLSRVVTKFVLIGEKE